MSVRSESFKAGVIRQLEETFKDATTFFNAYENKFTEDYGLRHIQKNHMISDENRFSELKKRLNKDKLSLNSGFNIRNYKDLAKLMPAIKDGIKRQLEKELDEMRNALDTIDNKGKYTFTIDLNQCIGTTVSYIGNKSFAEFPCSSLTITLMAPRDDKMFDILTAYPAPNRREQMEINHAKSFALREREEQNKMRRDLRGEPKGDILTIEMLIEQKQQKEQNDKTINMCKGLLSKTNFATVGGIIRIKELLKEQEFTISIEDKKSIFEMLMQKPIKGNIEDIVAALPPEGQSPGLLVRYMEEKPEDFIEKALDGQIAIDEKGYGGVSIEQFTNTLKKVYDSIQKNDGVEKANEYLNKSLSKIDFMSEEQVMNIYVNVTDIQTFVQALIDGDFAFDTSQPLMQGIKEIYNQIVEQSGIEDAEKYLDKVLDETGFENGCYLITNDEAIQLRKEIANEQTFSQEDINNIIEQLGDIPNEPEISITHQEYDVEEIGA